MLHNVLEKAIVKEWKATDRLTGLCLRRVPAGPQMPHRQDYLLGPGATDAAPPLSFSRLPPSDELLHIDILWPLPSALSLNLPLMAGPLLTLQLPAHTGSSVASLTAPAPAALQWSPLPRAS